jgi:hypothetical protein
MKRRQFLNKKKKQEKKMEIGSTSEEKEIKSRKSESHSEFTTELRAKLAPAHVK